MPSSVTKDAKTVSNDFSRIQKQFFVRLFATFHRAISKILQLGGNNIYIFIAKTILMLPSFLQPFQVKL